MATHEDSSVLRQLIDQIDDELSSFQDLGGSDGSLTSFTTSQGSLASAQSDSRSGSTLATPVVTQRKHDVKEHQQQLPRPKSATSAIFGATFERQSLQPGAGASTLVMNGSYFLGPRAPQYIPSPMASPISPNSEDSCHDQEMLQGEDIGSSQSLRGVTSHGSFAAIANQLSHNHKYEQVQVETAATIKEECVKAMAESDGSVNMSPQSLDQTPPFDDNIKVEVEKQKLNADYENYKVEVNSPTIAARIGGLVPVNSNEHHTSSEDSMAPGTTPLKLLELSFSNDNITSFWSPGSKSSSSLENLQASLDGPDKRSRSQTFPGLTNISNGQEMNGENVASSFSTLCMSSSAYGLESKSSISTTGVLSPKRNVSSFPTNQSPPLNESHHTDSGNNINDYCRQESSLEAGGPGDNHVKLQDQMHGDRKRLSLVTSGEGLAAAVAAAAASRSSADMVAIGGQEDKSVPDLPSWDLDLVPLSPPMAVKETSGMTASPSEAVDIGASSGKNSPMNIRRGSLGTRQEGLSSFDSNSLNSPLSATVMTPTTPLTTRESRILAGRETLLRSTTDKQRVARGTSSSSTMSSVVSSSHKLGEHGIDVETVEGSQYASRRSSVKSVEQATGGVFGAVPQRGQQNGFVPGKLLFPDQSIRPVPLKAYRVRKMTLTERNQTYAQACQEFTKARTGLDIWALRCMMQDRPALMKDPPTIVKAVAGKFTPGAGSAMNSGQGVFSIQEQRAHTPTLTHSNTIVASNLGSNTIGGGIGARIKNAGKRLSMDISGGMHGTFVSSGILGSDSTAHHGSNFSSGSMLYKQKTANSAVELGTWSSNLTRGSSNSSVIPPHAAASTSGNRNPIIGTNGTPAPQRSTSGAPTSASPVPTGSGFLLQNKRNNFGVSGSSPLSNSLRGRTMSDAQTGSQFLQQKSNTQGNLVPQERPQSLDNSKPESDFMSLPVQNGGGTGREPLSPSPSTLSTCSNSAMMERPIRRSTSTHYTRRPASMMVIPSSSQQPRMGQPKQPTGSSTSIASQSSSSLGSVSSSSITESRKTPPLAIKQHEREQQRDTELNPSSTISGPSLSSYYNSEGEFIPYADDASSKEVYSPLTSPIMIPLGGFPEPKRTTNTSTNLSSNGGWSSPLSPGGGGLTRPLTYAGQSSYPFSSGGSNSSLIMSPSSLSRTAANTNNSAGMPPLSLGMGTTMLPGSGPVHYSNQPNGASHNNNNFKYDNSGKASNNNSGGGKESSEKSAKNIFGSTLNRYSTSSSFASIGSFSSKHKSGQKRSSKKEKRREEEEQQQQQQQHQQQAEDQRFSVASNSVAPTNDFLIEQSLDKLSDVLPHVDRDRLAIYLQRAYGDEMVAIGLAMSDFRTGQL